MAIECTRELFNNKSLKHMCELAKNCSYSYINFNKIHYCDFEGNLFLSLPLLFIVAVICFYLLSDTAHKYLSQASTNISNHLNFSQNLAGVTLLAFGNGANDVVSSIIASDDGEGLDVSISFLLGGGLFVSCFVFSIVLFYSGNILVRFIYVFYFNSIYFTLFIFIFIFLD